MDDAVAGGLELLAELGRSEELLLEVNDASSWAAKMDGSLLAVASAHAQKCATDLYMSVAGCVKLRAAVQVSSYRELKYSG